MHFLPAPGFVLSCQLGVAALTMRVCGSLGYLEVDHIEWVKFKRFVWVIIGFLGTIFCNIKVRCTRARHHRESQGIRDSK